MTLDMGRSTFFKISWYTIRSCVISRYSRYSRSEIPGLLSAGVFRYFSCYTAVDERWRAQVNGNVRLGTPRRCVNVRGIREWSMAAAVHAERGPPSPRYLPPRIHDASCQDATSATAAATWVIINECQTCCTRLCECVEVIFCLPQLAATGFQYRESGSPIVQQISRYGDTPKYADMANRDIGDKYRNMSKWRHINNAMNTWKMATRVPSAVDQYVKKDDI